MGITHNGCKIDSRGKHQNQLKASPSVGYKECKGPVQHILATSGFRISEKYILAMRLFTTAIVSLHLVGLSWAQSRPPRPIPTAAGTNGVTQSSNDYVCGEWAGRLNPTDLPTVPQLAAKDKTVRFFVEPQLMDPPFQPITATEPKVQIPKLWGNSISPRRVQILLLNWPCRWVPARFNEPR